MELVTISSGALTARINPLGAELWSLIDAAGAEYMTDADPAFWGGHAPLLFPVVGSLAGDVFRHHGQTYALPRHGFARRAQFEVVEAGLSYALFRLVDSPETREVYPFAFALKMAFALEGTSLHMAATVSNRGDEPMPFSFGYHPAFAWPLPDGGAKEGHVIRFAEEEPAPVRRVGKGHGLVLPEKEATPVKGCELALSPDLFVADAVIWDELASRALSYVSSHGTRLDIAFPDTPQLGLWQVPGARYICIEPWAGHADPLGFDGEITQKPAIILLPAGESRSFRMDVSLAPR